MSAPKVFNYHTIYGIISLHVMKVFISYSLKPLETFILLKLYLLVAKLLYKYKCPSVCRSGYKRQKCRNKETWFSFWLFKIEVWFFFVKSCLIDAHLFYEYFIRQSVGQAKKDKKVFTSGWKVLWCFLFLYTLFSNFLFNIYFS